MSVTGDLATNVQATVTAEFWFATFVPAPTAGRCELLRAISGLTDPTYPPTAIAVEVRRWSDSRWTVVVSVADRLDAPTVLHAVFGVSSDPEDSDKAALSGIPMIEARFNASGSTLSVDAVAYPERNGSAPVSAVLRPLMTVEGLLPSQVPDPAGSPFQPIYRQVLVTPDIARPASELLGRVVDSAPKRTSVTSIPTPSLAVSFNTALYPDLFELISAMPAAYLWTGLSGPFEEQPGLEPKVTGGGDPLLRLDRVSAFGAPMFVFQEVEIIGFRTELTSTADLTPLIDRLNFHRNKQEGGGPIDFRYDIATPTVVIELLRYGKMRTSQAAPPFTDEDFTSQHELLVRLLVGRVDDDTPQAHEPALFVPTIFVDNPWSKFVGRRLEGFPKVLAEFYAGSVLLDMNGNETSPSGTGGKVPFHELTEIRLASADASPSQAPLLRIDCPDAGTGSSDAFVAVPLPTILGGTAIRRGRFDQADFSDVEFRRSFAREVVAEQFTGYRVVQVSPVEELGLPSAWITGRCELEDVEVAFPTGIATLELLAPPSAPPAWKRLCTIIPQSGQTVGFPTGDWYRVRCSMKLTVDDALAW